MSVSIEILPLGVVLLRGALADAVQQAIISSIVKQVHAEPKTALLLEKDIKYAQLLMWNWPDRYGSMCADDACSEPPEDVLALAPPLLAAIRKSLASTTASETSVDARLLLPASFAADSMRVIGYGADGCLPEHNDMYMGHTLSVSLGASCDFTYGSGYVDGKLADATTIRLASGDAVIFNGQRLPHSVPAVYDDVPSWWSSCPLLCAAKRVNIQLRHCAAVSTYGSFSK